MGESGSESNAPLDDTLAVFEDAGEPTTPRTVEEIAAKLDCPTRSAEQNLTELTTRGELETRRVGDERVWWRPAESTGLTDGRGDDEGRPELPAGVYERITDAFYALDDEWRFTYLNERAEEIIGRSKDELLGERLWDEFPEATESVVWDEYHEAMETQEPVDFDLYYEPLDIWAQINAYPSETGLSVYFVDISEQVESEQELSRYERIVETINDGVYAVDPEGRFTMVNEAYTELLGYDREELVGEHVSKIVDEEVVEMAQSIEEQQVAGEREAPTLEAELQTADGERIIAEGTFALLPLENG
jgi:PAS domain S-box-containing protein